MQGMQTAVTLDLAWTSHNNGGILETTAGGNRLPKLQERLQLLREEPNRALSAKPGSVIGGCRCRTFASGC